MTITLGKQEFVATTSQLRELCKRLLDFAENNQEFNTFCDYLVGTLRSTWVPIQCNQNRLWRAFHKQSVEELPSKWKKLYRSLSLADVEEKFFIFNQTVNVVVYEQLLKQHFVADRPSKGDVDDDQEVQLSLLFTK